jgi:hypothetical protein
MTVYWVNSPTDSAFDAMQAVEQALETGDTGLAPSVPVVEPEPLDISAGDSYLATSLESLHATWPIDPHAIVASNRPYLGWAINRFQQLVRRATWWYTLPQWLQVAEFHGATVRTIDSMLEQQRQLRLRLAALETPHTVDRIQALEAQLRGLRADLEALRREVAPPTPRPPKPRAKAQAAENTAEPPKPPKPPKARAKRQESGDAEQPAAPPKRPRRPAKSE